MTDAEQRQLIFPVCTTVGITGLCGYLAYYALAIESGARRFRTTGLSARDGWVARIIQELAAQLGVVGSIAISVVVSGAMIGWTAYAVRQVLRARVPRIAANVVAYPIDAEVLAAGLRAWRRQFRNGLGLLAAVSLIGGAILFVFANGEGVALAMVAFLFSMTTALLTLRDPRRQAIVQRLATRPGDLVWVYLENEGRFAWLRVGFDDGALRGLPVARERADEVMHVLCAATPCATHGYSDSARARFDPAELRRAPDQR